MIVLLKNIAKLSCEDIITCLESKGRAPWLPGTHLYSRISDALIRDFAKYLINQFKCDWIYENRPYRHKK